MIDGKFINPYNFVLPDENVFRKAFMPFNRFDPDHYSGQIAISIKSVDDIPIFIPDSKQKKYWIILGDKIEFKGVDPNKDIDKEYFFKIENKELEKRNDLPLIKPLSDYKDSNELLNALKERSKWIKGSLKEFYNDAKKKNKKYCIETENPGDYVDKAHAIMKFCKDPKGNPIIPSTSIKGLLHSIVEIFSNSCFAHVEGGRLGKRGIPGKNGYHPLTMGGIITKMPSEKSEGEIQEKKTLKISYKLLREKKLEKFINNPEKSGEQVFVSINYKKKIEDISLNHSPQCNMPGVIKTSGERAGQNGKNNERVFVGSGEKIYRLPFQVYQDYLTANRNCQSKKAQKLSVGDPIWFYGNNDRVATIGFTQVHRKAFNFSIEDKIVEISPNLHFCDNINKLCPACNMFGSTDLIEQENEQKKKIAISGKISFGLGKLINSSTKLEEAVPLKILSSPKPSCTYFYLQYDEHDGNYDNRKSKIRGRKLYYHHSKDNLKYKRVEGDSKGDIIIDNHNVSIETLKDFEFKSTIDFMNLSEYELGLLLFALDMKNKEGNKVYHKIGMGKPLGLGTIIIDIDKENSFIINRKKRYSTFLTPDGEIETGKEFLKVSDYIKVFQEKQIGIYNKDKNSNEQKSDFYAIPYISDIFNILEINSLPGDYPEIKYPRKTVDNEPRGFEWFVQEQQKKSPPQNLPLPLEVSKKDLDGWS